MKLVKAPTKYNMYEYNKEKANKGCNVCPYCGEKKTLIDWLKEGRMLGVSNGIYYNYFKGFFKTKIYRVDCYHCNTCGGKWESEPYLSESEYKDKIKSSF